MPRTWQQHLDAEDRRWVVIVRIEGVGPVRWVTQLDATGRYAFIDAQPLYGFPEDRQEVSVGSSARFNENWRVFAAGTYDLEESSLISGALGFGYDDECFSYLLSMSETRNATTDEVQRSFGFNISLRTLGDFGSNSAAFAQ